MAKEDLLYRVEGDVAYLTINRESKRNSISSEVTGLFLEYLERAETDDAVRVVTVTGAGERAFCSGADLGGNLSEEGLDSFQQYADLIKKLAGFPKPSVARING